jgi:hypothetical protein
MQVVISLRVTRRRAVLPKINTRMILSMMGAKKKKRPANAYLTKKVTSALKMMKFPEKLQKSKTFKIVMRLIHTKTCQSRRMMVSGATTKRLMNTTWRGGSHYQHSSSTHCSLTSAWVSHGFTTFIAIKWAGSWETIWVWVRQCKLQLC